MDIGIDASRAFTSQPTGTENYSLSLIKALAKIDRKNRYTLYTMSPLPNLFPERPASWRGVEGLLNYSRPSTSSGTKYLFPDNFNFRVIPWPYLWTQAGLALECLKSPPDVLFIPAHTMPILRRPGFKTVVTIHDLGAEFLPQYHQFPQKFYLNKATEYAVGHATHLIAVSESTKKDLISKLHCDTEKISVIHEGYDREKFKVPFGSSSGRGQSSKFKVAKMRKKYGINGDYILFVGTIQPRKNLQRLIQAFAEILTPNISLVIVGRPGWMCEKIYAAPEKFGVADKVKFLNYVPKEDLPLFYQNALCFILPSLYEGFGLPVLEAMACGCPVIASKTSSLSEVVGAAGLLVDPYDINDITKNLECIIENVQLRRELVRKGLEQVKKFSWEKCARETLKVLGKI